MLSPSEATATTHGLSMKISRASSDPIATFLTGRVNKNEEPGVREPKKVSTDPDADAPQSIADRALQDLGGLFDMVPPVPRWSDPFDTGAW